MAVDLAGPEAINEFMQQLRQTLPAEATFVQSGPASAHHEFVHFPWALRVGDAAIATGWDSVTVGAGGVLSRIVVFFDSAN